jgi:hypothetical protein
MAVGAAAGSLSGGNTSVALAPAAVPAAVAGEIVSSQPLPPVAPVDDQTSVREITRAAPQATPGLSANAVVAMRFPAHWQAAAFDPTTAPSEAMAYAPEQPAQSRPAVREAPAEAPGYRLASVDPAPAQMPKRVARPKPKNDVLFNDAQLRSIKARLKLTPQQEQYWPQVEQALRAISWRLATQQNAKRPVRGAKAQMIDPNSPEVARLKSAAIPLIMSMRSDQKEEVRQLAHTMGLSQVASMF